MKPAPFKYYDPTTVDEAVGLIGRLENTKLLAGGQSLMPMLNMRYVFPDHLIDLNNIAPLSFIRRDKDTLSIGAMTRQRDLEFSTEVASLFPIVGEAIQHLGHRQTRNRGTLGGSLCHLDPSAELVCISAVLDAVLRIDGPGGSRQLAFSEFPQAFMSPAIGFDELLTSVNYSLWPQPHGYAFEEVARRHGDFALASAAAMISISEAGCIERAAIAVGGVAVAPVRLTSIEKMLCGSVLSKASLDIAAADGQRLDALEDAHVPASYRRRIAAHLI